MEGGNGAYAVRRGGVRRNRVRALMLAALALVLTAGREPPLRVYAVDVEGGFATLYVTPQGHSLLIDTGWRAGLGGQSGEPDSVDRIVSVMREAHVQRINTLLVTHYHRDHVGGAVELMARVPVDRVVDHGPNREFPPGGQQVGPDSTVTLYAGYLKALGARPHIVLRPGDRISVDALEVTAVDSDRAIVAEPLPGAGTAGAGCDRATANDRLGGEENPRSLGVLVRWGAARILSLGDTTWEIENSLVCPRDLIGPVDLMFADNHGSDNATSPVFVDTVRPRVVVFNNGPMKGASPDSIHAVQNSPRLQDAWQIHQAEAPAAANVSLERIVNVSTPKDAMLPLRLNLWRDRTISVLNGRTGATAWYRPN
jgi:beta-lactamase superfamily II metal-dependent hydrolase